MTRLNRWALAALVSAVSLAACAAPTPTAAPPTAVPQATATAPAAVFPVSVEHRLGTAEIEAAPERVVAIGGSDLDSALGVGVVPIAAMADYYTADGISPWLQGRLDPAQTELLPNADTLPIETIAAKQPDLILATGWYAIDTEYPLLEQLAPTVVDVHGPLADPWQEQTVLIGQALGRQPQAEQLVADTEAQIEAFLAEYPDAAGKTFSLSIVYDTNAIATVYDEKDLAVQFFNDLGLTVTPGLTELAQSAVVESAVFTFEKIDLLEADLVIFSYGSPELKEAYAEDPLLMNLKETQGDRFLEVDLVTVASLRNPTVLAIPWLLEQLKPGFAALQAGN